MDKALKYQLIFFALLSLANMVLMGITINHASKNKIYTIGVNRLTDSFTKNLNSSNLSSEQQNLQVINFGKGLEAALLEFKVQGKVLLMEEAVLSGGTDITIQVVNRIKGGMDNHG